MKERTDENERLLSHWSLYFVHRLRFFFCVSHHSIRNIRHSRTEEKKRDDFIFSSSLYLTACKFRFEFIYVSFSSFFSFILSETMSVSKWMKLICASARMRFSLNLNTAERKAIRRKSTKRKRRIMKWISEMLRVQWPTDSERVLFTTGFYHSLRVSQWLSE